ncbi:hypothetical protein GIB67_004022 [Kingdonia uniflora]|uniref:Uncharacterized protein n=1 Tax=Kingdonia uniflora TaxID=39325 RepID=A0A7J7NRF3_9MAGN|nr:hypothetical protein GIB67_004022 [Kingdonia uniflora]
MSLMEEALEAIEMIGREDYGGAWELKGKGDGLIKAIKPLKNRFPGADTALQNLRKAIGILCNQTNRSEFDCTANGPSVENLGGTKSQSATALFAPQFVPNGKPITLDDSDSDDPCITKVRSEEHIIIQVKRRVSEEKYNALEKENKRLRSLVTNLEEKLRATEEEKEMEQRIRAKLEVVTERSLESLENATCYLASPKKLMRQLVQDP